MISSPTFMVPISAAREAPTNPDITTDVSSGASSRQKATPITLLVYSTGPKIRRTSATVMARVTPTKKLTRKTIGMELTPTRTAWRADSCSRTGNPLKGPTTVQ